MNSREKMMSEHTFDALIRRAATAASRRDVARALAGFTLGGIWSSVAGNDDIEARKKGGKNKNKKRKGKNKKNRNVASSPLPPADPTSPPPPTSPSSPPPPPPPVSCTPSCTGKVCGDDGCGGSCGACGAGQLCAQGQCVTGQGTCESGQDICDDFSHRCDIGSNCYCWTSTSNQTRCGYFNTLSNDDQCVNDNECAALFPDVPGVFCVVSSGPLCTGVGGFCYAPCLDI
jgi:hypothetical protein